MHNLILNQIISPLHSRTENKEDVGYIIPVSNRNFGLDLVRCTAICFVILSHFGKFLEVLGFWGVEIFFGLSGFLIGQILWRHYHKSVVWNKSEIFNFWTRRWWRTLPNYYLFFIISLFYQYYIAGGLPTLGRLSTFLWFGQDLLHRQDDFYGVSWSLCIEEGFYFLFPLVLYGVSKIKISKQQTFLFTIFLFVIACSFVRFTLIHNYHEASVRGVTLARLDSIACGVFVSFFISIVKVSERMKYILLLAGIIILCASYYLTRTFPAEVNSITLLLTPLGISLGLPLISKLPDLPLSFKFLKQVIQNMSLWSYSLYLCHIPILFTTYFALEKYRENTSINLLSKIIALAISVFVSAMLFKYFELPLTKMRRPESKS